MSLTDDELRVWHAWKTASDRVRASVAQDLAAETGLSDPDFGVLSRVADAGGALRQNELASSMGWHRSRLSHQLTRMEQREMVTRRNVGGGVEVLITAAGQRAIDAARPVHAEAVRKYLVEAIPSKDLARFTTALEKIGDSLPPADD